MFNDKLINLLINMYIHSHKSEEDWSEHTEQMTNPNAYLKKKKPTHVNQA